MVGAVTAPEVGDLLLPLLSFGLALVVAVCGAAVQLLTVAFVIGRMSSTAATMVKAVDEVRRDLNGLRAVVSGKFDVLNATLADEAGHNRALAARVDDQARRAESVERRVERLEA
jgi:hypothetical protein